MARSMFKLNFSTKKLFVSVVVFQLLAVLFFADFHLGTVKHELGEKPHIHFSFNEDEHSHDGHHTGSLLVDVESLFHEHDHASEIHIHLNLIEAKPTVQALLNLPASETFLSSNSAISSVGQKPLLPPPTA